MFHAQEKRLNRLTKPIATTNPDAWLGNGYYFWYYEEDAVFWGRTAKKSTGHFEVYKAKIDFENVLDTVFDENHYLLWIEQIEKAITNFIEKPEAGAKISIKDINDFFKDKGVLDGVEGLMFQDITSNRDYYFVKNFQYKKRIQVAVYSLNIISNF